MALDVYLTGNVKDHLSEHVGVCSFVACATQLPSELTAPGAAPELGPSPKLKSAMSSSASAAGARRLTLTLVECNSVSDACVRPARVDRGL